MNPRSLRRGLVAISPLAWSVFLLPGFLVSCRSPGGTAGAVVVADDGSASANEQKNEQEMASCCAADGAVHTSESPLPDSPAGAGETQVADPADGAGDSEPKYTVSEQSYTIPDVVLLDQEGDRVSLKSLLAGPRPVAVNFVFTTCTTICPVMSATFSQMQKELGEDADGLRFVSLTLDPEYDSPPVLKAYSERFQASSDWTFLTGEAARMSKAYRAFNAWTGSKFSHTPFTLFKLPEGKGWIRVDGLTSAADLATVYRSCLQNPEKGQQT